MATNPGDPYTDDEIDLREYLDVLILWWREILLLTVLAAIVAALSIITLRFVQQPVYEASSTVAIVSLVSDVTLEDRFRTLSDDGGGGSSPAASQARHASLVGLVKNSAIAEATISELGMLLEEEERDPAQLMRAVEAEIVEGPTARVQSDLIRITATADDPEKARAIANTWAKNYVDNVNQIYSYIPDSVIDAVGQEVTLANERYAVAQHDLEVFTTRSQISQLSRDIQEKQTIVDNLQANKIAIIKTQLDLQQKEQQLRFDLFEKLHNAEIRSAMAVFDEQLTQNLDDLSQLNDEYERSQRFLARTEVLQEEIQAGGDAAIAANALAIELLKAQFYASVGPISLDIDSPTRQTADAEAPPTISAAQQEQDISSLTSALKAYLNRIDDEISTRSDTLLQGTEIAYLDQISADNFTLPGLLSEPQLTTMQASTNERPLADAISDSYASMFSVNNIADLEQNEALLETTAKFTNEIMKIEEKIHASRAAMEAEQSQQQQLVQRRDLAWSAYDTVAKKLTELNLERVAINSVVRMGALAPTPAKSIATVSLKMAIPLAAMIGMMSAVFIAFLANYLEYKPFLSAWRDKNDDVAAATPPRG